MEFSFRNPDLEDTPLGEPVVIGYPSDPNGEFIINDPQYGERVVHQIDFHYVSPSSLIPAIETGDESLLREHVLAQPEPGWLKLVNIIGYAAIRPDKHRPGKPDQVLVRVRDFKETRPYQQF